MTLLFIHGAGFTGECFREQLGAFPDACAPDLPGHSTPGSAANIPEFADFIAAFIAERRLTDVVLCGHSMGGAIALELALRRHPAVRSVALLGSGARLRVAPAIFERLECDFEDGARFLAGFFFADPDPGRIEWAVGEMRATGAAQTIRDFRACDAFDASARLEELRLPVVAITGEFDRLTPPKYAQLLADRIPGAAARILAGAGHFAMVERPAETNAALAAFLSGAA